MNVLVTINTRYADYLEVMLTSLFENHRREKITIYCLFDSFSKTRQEELEQCVKKYNQKIYYIQIDPEHYHNFPTTDELTIECYFILLAHLYLPSSIKRILYLDSDMIINGSLKPLYNIDFQNHPLVVCGQAPYRIEGEFFPKGAIPAKGECFNSGVILFDVEYFRKNITADTYIKAANDSGYRFLLADQGILNLIFAKNAKYVPTLKYNFRIGIFEEYEIEIEKKKLAYRNPLIIHYVMRDYFGIGYGTKPWTFSLKRIPYFLLKCVGVLSKKKKSSIVCSEIMLQMHTVWWKYAKKTSVYTKMKKQMRMRRRTYIIKKILGQPIDVNKKKENKKEIRIPNQFAKRLDSITYKQLDALVSKLPVFAEIEILKGIHEINVHRLNKKSRIKVAFIVYSSAEWQCDELYAKMKESPYFEPVIVICGYGVETNKMVRDAYVDTLRYFENRKIYSILPMGYLKYSDQVKEDMIDSFDIFFDSNPYAKIPECVNMGNRNIRQLYISVPYGFYLVGTKGYEDYYNGNKWDYLFFRMLWIYFCESPFQEKIVKNEQRTQGYNIITSGLPKMDVFFHKNIEIADDLWKEIYPKSKKVIWAPHFNMALGMNGTFHENYEWIYNYAKNHPEISWVVKPHPRLEQGVMKFKVFETRDAYKRYMEEWDSLPNAKVVTGGGYEPYFLTSDAMITDCDSFLCEYQYVSKPLLLLLPEKPRGRTAFGDELIKLLYVSRGNRYDCIESFIKEVVVCQRDSLKVRREDFFKKYLDYREFNFKLATDYIFDYLKVVLGKEDKEEGVYKWKK